MCSHFQLCKFDEAFILAVIPELNSVNPAFFFTVPQASSLGLRFFLHGP
jgi:hypothetical protein